MFHVKHLAAPLWGAALIKSFARGLIKYGLIPLAYRLVRLYLLTVRTRVVGEDALFAHLDAGGKGIAAFWHQRFFCLLGYAHRLGKYAPSAIISQSRDGDLLAQVVTLCNLRPIRGSSSKGGKQALKAILMDLKLNPFAAHALDGPQGPQWVVKPGLVAMAQRSQAPVIPLYVSMDRAWALRSWDRLLIPKPFCRLLVYWGRPIVVAAELNPDQFEATRAELEGLMKSRQLELDEAWRAGKGVISHDNGR